VIVTISSCMITNSETGCGQQQNHILLCNLQLGWSSWPAAECQSQESKLKLTRFLDLNLLPCLPCSEDQQRDSREMHAPFRRVLVVKRFWNCWTLTKMFHYHY
jgi:hypothetical protein